MDKIFKQLNNLPKHKLKKRADFKLRFMLVKKLWQKKLLLPSDFMVVRRFAPVAAVFVALCLIIIIPTYSYASSGVTYGHILYPVKQTIEKVELALISEPEAKVEKIEKFATRRLAEAEVISENYSDDNKALLTTIAKAVELKTEAQVISDNIIENPQIATPTPVAKAQEDQVESLIKVAQNVGIKTDDATLDKVSAALDFMKLPPGQAKKYKRDKSTGSEDDPLAQAGKEEESGIDKNKTAEEETETGAGPEEPDEKVEKPWNNKTWQKREDAQKNLETIISEIKKFKDEIKEDEYEEEEVETLFERLDNKVEKTEEAIDDEEDEETENLFKSIESLKNNGKYFIKQKNKNKKWQDEDEDADDDKYENNSKSRGGRNK